MFLRLQKEKIKKSKDSSIYNLDSNPEEMLTHKGSILGNSNINENDFSDDEDDENLNKEVVNRLHFGGGLIEKSNHSNDDMMSKPISRGDTLQDIIMKSKMQKLQKKEIKEEQELETERLDKEFRQLVSASEVQFRPNKHEPIDRKADNYEYDENDDYDRLLRSMMFETKVSATDRTKSVEEIAIEAKKKLEELEKARIIRMTKIPDKTSNENKRPRERTDDEIVDEAFDFKNKNKQSKKKVEPSDDEEEEEEEEEEDEDEDDDEDSENENDDEEENDDDDDSYEIDDYDNENQLEDTNENENEEIDDENDEEEEEEDDEEDDENENEKDELDNEIEQAYENDEDNDMDEESETEIKLTKREIRQNRKNNAKQLNSNNENTNNKIITKESINNEMPHNIVCPNNFDEFNELLNKYVINNKTLELLINNILTWNNIHLPGQEGKENVNKMHNFMNILLKYFIIIGDLLGIEANNDANDNEILEKVSKIRLND